jgi:hypothetical protein
LALRFINIAFAVVTVIKVLNRIIDLGALHCLPMYFAGDLADIITAGLLYKKTIG